MDNIVNYRTNYLFK